MDVKRINLSFFKKLNTVIKNHSKFFILLLIILLVLILYWPSIHYYFFQDDFFEINISKAQNIGEYINFFKFRDDIIAYRPISLQNYFFISSKIFGLNPAGFRLITFIFFFSSAFLIIQLVTKITKNINIGLLTASLWILSSIHFMAITWIAAAYNIIGTFFWLLTSLFFLEFLKKQNLSLYLITLVFFLFTIGSFEFSVTWPVIFGFYYFFVLNNRLLKSVKVFSPFITFSIIYLALRMFLIKIPEIVEYKVTFNLDSIKALFWYVLWAFNIPEEFKKQVVGYMLVFNWKFFSEFWPLVIKTFIGAFLVLILGIFIPLFRIIRYKFSVNYRLSTFALVWFFVGIFPVLILPNHTFSMYLTLPSIGVYLLISYFIGKSQKAILFVLITLIWLATSLTSLNFYKVNSWMIEAQKTARKASIDLKQNFPTLPKNSIVLYPLNNRWEKQALLGDAAIRAVYNDSSLSIYYNKEALIRDVHKIGNRPVYIYLPR